MSVCVCIRVCLHPCIFACVMLFFCLLSLSTYRTSSSTVTCFACFIVRGGLVLFFFFKVECCGVTFFVVAVVEGDDVL